MKYTILSAAYANQEHTSAIIITAESSAVVASLVDTPDIWDDVIAAEPSAYVIPENELPPSKEARIEALQVTYEIDRVKLNQVWLAAMIADGVGEVGRKAVIVGQMSALEAQLDADILAIIMEE